MISDYEDEDAAGPCVLIVPTSHIHASITSLLIYSFEDNLLKQSNSLNLTQRKHITSNILWREELPKSSHLPNRGFECIYEGSPDEGLPREVIKEALRGADDE